MLPALLLIAATTTSTTVPALCRNVPALESLDIGCFDRGDCTPLERELARTAICYRYRATTAERDLADVTAEAQLRDLERPLDVAPTAPFPLGPTIALVGVAVVIGLLGGVIVGVTR